MRLKWRGVAGWHPVRAANDAAGGDNPALASRPRNVQGPEITVMPP
jgi:hypothetical protein